MARWLVNTPSRLILAAVPNQRRKGAHLAAAFIDDADWLRYRKLASARKLKFADWLREAMREKAAREMERKTG